MRSWQEAYRGLLPDAYLAELTVEQHVEYWAAYLEDPPEADRLWVSEEAGRLVGYVRTGLDDEDGRDGRIFAVAADAGPAPLVEHAVEDLRERILRDATVWVLDGDLAAETLYRTLGFEPDGTTGELEGAGVGQQRLRRGLNELSS